MGLWVGTQEVAALKAAEARAIQLMAEGKYAAAYKEWKCYLDTVHSMQRGLIWSWAFVGIVTGAVVSSTVYPLLFPLGGWGGYKVSDFLFGNAARSGKGFTDMVALAEAGMALCTQENGH